jgi:hypothetical protein
MLSVALIPDSVALELVLRESGHDPRSGWAEGIDSSMAVVHGLCRQTGGRLTTGTNGGAHCSIRFEAGNWGKWIQ